MLTTTRMIPVYYYYEQQQKICGAFALTAVILNITENALLHFRYVVYSYNNKCDYCDFSPSFPSSYVSAIELFVQVFTFLLYWRLSRCRLQMCKCRRYWWWNCKLYERARPGDSMLTFSYRQLCTFISLPVSSVPSISKSVITAKLTW